MHQRKINLLLLFNFIATAIFNMGHPVTPKLINTLGFPAYMFGVFFAFMSIANFVMSPIWGAFSDQRGRKKFMAIGVLGYGLSQVGFGLNTEIGIILIFRLLSGTFSICFITTAIAYMTDLTSVEERIKYLSYHTATAAIGGSTGALLGGILGKQDYRYAFLAQGILGMVVALAIWLAIEEETVKRKHKLTIYLEHLKPGKTFVDFKTTIGTMIIVTTLITITVTSYNSTISYYVESVLKLPTTVNGLVMALSGVVGLIMNLFVNPYIGKHFSERKSIAYATLLTGVSILAACIFNHFILFVGTLMIFMGASALVIPMQQSIVSKLAKDNYGEVMGIQGSAKAIGMVVGSLSAGFMFEIWNKSPFLLGGICAMLAFYAILRINKVDNSNRTNSM